MDRDYSYSYAFDERYCYPHSDVLMNKLGIQDAEELKKAEREITSLRLANARVYKIRGQFDLQHLKDIHKYIFQDVYDWAGEIRWVNIAKGNMFCNYPFIEANAESLFTKLKKEKYLKEIPEQDMPIRLAYYLSEINVIHPFREGNGRSQRLWIEYLAEENGYSVDFSEVTAEEMIQASAEAFACQYDCMNQLFQRITKRIETIETSIKT